MLFLNKIYKNLWLAVLGCSLIFGSCKSELELNPLDQFSNENFWRSEGDAMLALTGLYRGNIQMNGLAEFGPSDWWSYHGLLYLEFASDNAYDRRGDNSAYSKLSDGTMTNSLGILSDYWRLSYRKIARSNFFLENVEKTPVSPDVMKRLKAEAQFIRASQYFYLSQYWGSVPLIKNTLNLQEANSAQKATKKEVVDFVISEFTEAAANLPNYGSLTSAERGRISKQGVLAFLGRIQLAEMKFADAAATYKAIIDLNENIIEPEYKGLFDGSNESSKEILFATQYLIDLAGNGMLQHNFPAIAGGWALYCPLGSLVESYQFKDGSEFNYNDARYNPKNLTQNRDPRLGFSVLTNQDLFKNLRYTSHPDSTNSMDQVSTTKQATRTGYSLRKFNPENFEGNLQNSGIDLPIIRYSEVLLSYLEAKLENGDPINQALLDQTINKVRSRASVQMPAITTTDQIKLRTILRNERRVELAFEGIRYWDLLRWNIAKDVLKGEFYGAPFPDAKNLRVNPSKVRDSQSRWYVTTKNFRSDVDRFWQIPQSEININPNLK